MARDAARHQILADGFGAPRAKRDVVFALATLVGVAFNREGVTVVIAQPLRLFVERRARLTGKLRGIGVEENAVTDINDKVLLTAGNCGAGQRALVGLFGAACDRKRCQNGGSEWIE